MNTGENKGKMTGQIENNNEWRNCIIKYTVSSIVFLIVCILLYNIISNPGSATYNTSKYFFVYMFPLVMIFAILLNLVSHENNRRPFLEMFGAFVILGAVVYYYALSTGYDLNITGTFNYLLLTAIILIALALVYNLLINYLSKLKGWPGFVADLLFYLPCALYDFWVYLLEQFQLTPVAIYGFIILEVLLIVLYFFLPNLSNYMIGTNDSLLLVKNVTPLNKGKQIIATSSMLKVKPSTEQQQMGIHEPYFPRNYAISFWVFVNNQSPSNYHYSRESQILNYGYLDKNGMYQVKPLVTYYGGGNVTDQPMERNKFVFYYVNYKDIALEEKLQDMDQKLENEITVMQKKLADYAVLVANHTLTEQESQELQQEVASLEKYKEKLTNTKQIKSVNKNIEQLNTAIQTKSLTTDQVNDLKHSITIEEGKLDIMRNDAHYIDDELDFLNKDSYNSMKDTFYPVSMPSQKWNQVVLNYSDNKVDLFINGQLERTFRLSGENASTKDTTIQSFIPQYSDLDTITIGDEFGVDGAVCNVEYYKRPLTSEQIAFQYNIFANSNPPVPREKKEQNSAQ